MIMDGQYKQAEKVERERKGHWGKKNSENTIFSCKVNISKTKIAHDQRHLHLN